MSKTQFPLPKGVDINNIEIDVKNNLLTIVYEQEKPVLKVGKWYTCNSNENNKPRLLLENNRMVGFDNSRCWGSDSVSIPEMWIPADMTKVKELLIKEADKRGYEGNKAKYIIGGAIGKESDIIRSTGFSIRDNNRFNVDTYKEGITLLDFKTGKWAEIVEEKKPLYVNQYGTEFFEGDKVYYLVSHTKNEILNCSIENMPEKQRCGNDKYSEIMTERECYKYIFDTWNS